MTTGMSRPVPSKFDEIRFELAAERDDARPAINMQPDEPHHHDSTQMLSAPHLSQSAPHVS